MYVWVRETSEYVLNTHHSELDLGFNKGIVVK